jgi:hypothetical protein
MGDVMTWLNKLKMGKYAQKFAENEIKGEILTEVGLDDLDYMGIQVLAHRKVLLKGIEELKRGRFPNEPPPPPTSSSSASAQAEAKEPEPAKQKHWSDVKPISDNKVDPGVETYDEAAEAAAFKAAVAEWRTGGQAAASSASDTTISINHKPAVQTVHSGGVWNNPFADNDDEDAPQSDLLSSAPEAPAGGGGALLNGDYDEEAEARAFKAAVSAWRNPGAAAAPGADGGSGTDVKALSAATDVAADLAKKMEDDFALRKQELAERREKAEMEMKERLKKKEQELAEMCVVGGSERMRAHARTCVHMRAHASTGEHVGSLDGRRGGPGGLPPTTPEQRSPLPPQRDSPSLSAAEGQSLVALTVRACSRSRSTHLLCAP